MSDLVGNPEDRFSRVAALILLFEPVTQISLDQVSFTSFIGTSFVMHQSFESPAPPWPGIAGTWRGLSARL